jgi:flagellar hook-length control protein FliK
LKPTGAPPVTAGAPADGAPALGTAGVVSGNAAQAQQTVAASMAKPAAPAQSAAEQVSVYLSRAIQSGATRFSIQLQPADLGRVEVRLDVARDGRVTAVVTADRQDTLDMLQRDARGLERALLNAGLKADSNSLSFSLRDQDNNGATFAQDGHTPPLATVDEIDEPAPPLDLAGLAALSTTAYDGNGRLNILV